jgi:hypothetical protein
LSLLHPPYTAWHLSYVAIGAALAHPIRFDRLGWTVLGFFLGLGIAAHALDELRGHPLRTGIADRALLAAATAAIAAAAAIGWYVGGWRLAPFIAAGALFAFGYNLEWFGGLLHNPAGLALAWGAFPVLTGYYTQHWSISAAAVVTAAAAGSLTLAQRALSTPARWMRRRVQQVDAIATLRDGTRAELATSDLLAPLEQALKAVSWGMVALAVGLLLAGR